METVREEERVDVVEWLEGEGRKEEKGLAVAAAMVQQIRDAVRRETRCTCSAGIAHNKVCCNYKLQFRKGLQNRQDWNHIHMYMIVLLVTMYTHNKYSKNS